MKKQILSDYLKQLNSNETEWGIWVSPKDYENIWRVEQFKSYKDSESFVCIGSLATWTNSRLDYISKRKSSKLVSMVYKLLGLNKNFNEADCSTQWWVQEGEESLMETLVLECGLFCKKD